MSLYYRPADFAPAAAGGDGAPGAFSGTTELSYAGLSAGVEAGVPMPSKLSQPAFPQGFDAGTLAAAAPSAAEASAFIATPGAEAAAIPAVPGASEPVSPLIQLIMKLPGMGAVNSFFEALAALFMPGPHLLGSFDLKALAQHAHGAVASLGAASLEHLPVSLSLLPANAPILQTLGHSTGHAFAAAAPGGMRGLLSEHGLTPSDTLNVSGQIDPANVQFEIGQQAGSLARKAGSAAAGQLTSGPAMSEFLNGSHLAGAPRLFSDQVGSAVFKSALSPALGGAASGSGVGLSQTVPVSSSAWPTNMNVNASAFAQEAPSVAQGSSAESLVSGPGVSQNVGAHLGSAGRPVFDGSTDLGPSGAVSERLGGRQLLASDSLPSYRPTLGGMDRSALSEYRSVADSAAAKTSPAAAAPEVHSLTGLKAKQLSLPGIKSGGGSTHHGKPVVDHIGYQVKGQAGHIAPRGGAVMDQIAHRSLKPASGEKAVRALHPSHQGGKHTLKAAPEQSVEGANEAVAGERIAQAPQGPAAQPGDATTGATTYTIRAGDCLWNIARNHLGSGLRWQEVYKLNADVLGANPDLIHPGTTIKLPGAGDLAAGQAGKYVVKSGDCLWDIAADKLGDATRWGEIYKANADVIGSDPRLILPGQELSIPGGCEQIAQAAPATPAADPALASAAPSAALQVTPQAAQAVQAAPQPTVQPVSWESQAGSAPQAPMLDLSQVTPSPQPVVPAATPAQAALPGPGAAEAATLRPVAQAQPGLSSLVPKSLRPDLSFLKGRPGKIN